MGGDTKMKLHLRKTLFVTSIEKCVEDVKQDEKSGPDFVISIMKPTDLVKGELRQILSKMGQFESEITKLRVCTFEM